MKYVLFSLWSLSATAASFGTITISGIVPSNTSITVNPTSGYNALDLVNGVTNQQVCSITEKNNTTAGYTVTLSSTNAGTLKNGTLGNVPYTAKYNNASVTLSTSPVTITNQGSQSTPINIVKQFTVTIPASPDVMTGTYSDTLTFTISAN